ncbi:biotin-dependent carboxyltransferase [Parahaliea sp. F7430]|uniref:Biotin-dependent carboxyltransferase n=1 Tax=Sediminihaliea albiluteola TaxID=2758564 RepID=A0A7W2TVF2_9GAMM|nr:biotin-dependent carboxyltransferase family protein [Sediminihaliea albiluteola]MBA6412616.1 biotin-dependent carboxyltransferase [Sediminihaliea albiluteola]
MSMEVLQPGLLSLLQDTGRFGQQRIGLTTGGPLDPEAFTLCNRLLGNEAKATLIEVSFGGLVLQSKVNTYICVTGAELPLQINGREAALWQVHKVCEGDEIKLGFAVSGCRAYLGVADGFSIPEQFGSTSTVSREKVGGLEGDKLQAGDLLPCPTHHHRTLRYLPEAWIPKYARDITVRVILGYQQKHFSPLQQRRFFSSQYQVSERCDRMGYRLKGAAIHCSLDGILSEGICFGAIQIPADGQPIVLLNDRQTIGGYPKIGSALSLDVARLAQLTPGATLNFEAITSYAAHNALHLEHYRLQHLPLLEGQA